MKATEETLDLRARNAIKREEKFLFDVAASLGKPYRVVVDTQEFLRAVKQWLIDHIDRYAHLATVWPRAEWWGQSAAVASA